MLKANFHDMSFSRFVVLFWIISCDHAYRFFVCNRKFHLDDKTSSVINTQTFSEIILESTATQLVVTKYLWPMNGVKLLVCREIFTTQHVGTRMYFCIALICSSLI